MASQCEVLVDSDDVTLANEIGQLVANEVWRIEDKYSRYNRHSLCSKINCSDGLAVSIDPETHLLLNFAEQCYQLSAGLFDITSGVLRTVWHFDASDNIPSDHAVATVMPLIGWAKISYDQHRIVVPKGMELDFGGIGKEYAVDRSIQLVKQLTNCPVLINLGGDLAVTAVQRTGQAWQVGVEHPGFEVPHTMVVSLYQGALATSGDAKRYLLKNSCRYSHILNPKTGQSIIDAPRSITVAAPQCIQAGMLATIAMLQGQQAKAFLNHQQIKHWLVE